MSDYYRYLDARELPAKPQNILLIEALRYCEYYGVKYIRYAKLKTLCNEKMEKLTQGAIIGGPTTDLGGNFNRLVEKLSYSAIRGEKPFFKRVQVSSHETRLYPDFQLINDYLRTQITIPSNPMDSIEVRRYVSDSVNVAHHLGRIVNRPRGLTESVNMTDSLGVLVNGKPVQTKNVPVCS